ncbi:hypothetical protein Bache_2359 [Bacteroides helcogenes P 36-108]|uniref:Uncharacterized protein n=1 Tax=Bacteroides helcogenes (strain ATCC 35417 / DSM 20613 / JCM 6297 / CCUG 15421 / P 36-108) TaxID=693979 RepID=E6SU54_BACT6|nr:hypothetical protein Bache_2359 [Bacteroides helcogenes P 36-108]
MQDVLCVRSLFCTFIKKGTAFMQKAVPFFMNVQIASKNYAMP